MNVRIIVPILLAYAFAAAAGAFAASVPTADQQFVQRAYEDGYAEVVLGKMAMQNGATDAAKMYGERMVTDRSRDINRLAKLAAADGVSVEMALPAEAQEELAKLQRLSGPAFDSAYVGYEADDHRKAIAAYQRESTSTKNAALKGYVDRSLPVLETHEALARKAAAQVGAPGGS